ncbi:MATE family efflux transporter [Lachnospiraceae bacterium ZAX-1]
MKDMTSGNPLKIIIFFTIPILLGNVFQQFYNMADAIIVGRFIGEDALAAVGSTGSIMFLVLGFNIGFAQGFGIKISHAYGAKDDALLKHYVSVSIILGLIISFIMTALTVSCSKQLLLFMKTPDNILTMANDYIIVIYAGMTATMFFNVFSSILRAVGDSKTPLYFLIVSSILNIALDLFFIIILHMGPEGAAYATVVSQGVSALLCCFYMFRKFDILKISKKDFYLDSCSVRQLLSIGVPMAVNYSITAIGVMVLQSAVNVFGSTVVAAYTAASKVDQLATQTMPALATTMSTYCGQNLGAGKYDRIYSGMNKGLILGFFCAGFAAFICVVFGNYMVGWFLSNPTESMLSYTTQYLHTISCYYAFLSLVFLYRHSLQGLGLGLVPMMSGILELIGRSSIVLLLLKPWGFTAVTLSSPFAWVVAGIPLLLVYYSWVKKMKKQLPLEASQPKELP